MQLHMGKPAVPPEIITKQDDGPKTLLKLLSLKMVSADPFHRPTIQQICDSIRVVNGKTLHNSSFCDHRSVSAVEYSRYWGSLVCITMLVWHITQGQKRLADC